jgi:hypothetical protein
MDQINFIGKHINDHTFIDDYFYLQNNRIEYEGSIYFYIIKDIKTFEIFQQFLDYLLQHQPKYLFDQYIINLENINISRYYHGEIISQYCWYEFEVSRCWWIQHNFNTITCYNFLLYNCLKNQQYQQIEYIITKNIPFNKEYVQFAFQTFCSNKVMYYLKSNLVMTRLYFQYFHQNLINDNQQLQEDFNEYKKLLKTQLDMTLSDNLYPNIIQMVVQQI